MAQQTVAADGRVSAHKGAYAEAVSILSNANSNYSNCMRDADKVIAKAGISKAELYPILVDASASQLEHGDVSRVPKMFKHYGGSDREISAAGIIKYTEKMRDGDYYRAVDIAKECMPEDTKSLKIALARCLEAQIGHYNGHADQLERIEKFVKENKISKEDEHKAAIEGFKIQIAKRNYGYAAEISERYNLGEKVPDKKNYSDNGVRANR
jgi:hypothetical protein